MEAVVAAGGTLLLVMALAALLEGIRALENRERGTWPADDRTE
jgi:hypothetical protein